MSNIKKDIEISFVIPCHNEEGNLHALIEAIYSNASCSKDSLEIIITDDYSTDNSWLILKQAAQQNPSIRVQRFKSRCGQSAAIWAGIQQSRGTYIVTLDADLQNDLRDLPKFLELLNDNDCICGTRIMSRQKGDSFLCFWTSQFANSIRRWILKDSFTDSSCSFRVFRKSCLTKIHFFHGLHRFLPILLSWEGLKVREVPINNNSRLSGRSHYSICNRIFPAFIDLLGVLWIKKRRISFEINDSVN